MSEVTPSPGPKPGSKTSEYRLVGLAMAVVAAFAAAFDSDVVRAICAAAEAFLAAWYAKLRTDAKEKAAIAVNVGALLAKSAEKPELMINMPKVLGEQ